MTNERDVLDDHIERVGNPRDRVSLPSPGGPRPAPDDDAAEPTAGPATPEGE